MKTRVSIITLAVLALLVLVAPFAAKTARAEGQVEVYVSMTVKAPDQKDPKQKGKAPEIEATVVNAPKLTPDKYTLSTTNQGQKVTLKPTKFQEYVNGTETIAIALVINGQEIWIGNDDIETDENAKYAGVLKNLEGAIDKMGLANAGPPGSKGVVISYSVGAEIKVPPTDLKNITGGALGGQKDYYHKIGTDMVQGISAGIAELSKMPTSRKALIVVGDGTDTDPEKAKVSLADLKKQAIKQNIQCFAIVYKPRVDDSPTVITTMIPTAKTVASMDGIASELDSIIARMADRYYLTFAGWDPTTETGLPWDGKDHDLVIKIDQTELEAVTLTLTPKWDPPKHGGFPWLVLVLVLVGGLLLIIIGVKIFSKKEVPMPVMMAPVMMAAAPEAPKPAGPMKTVMIGAGGDQDGFPIVGWLVALNGQNAYQTHRLKPGVTKIGTQPPSDIVVNDGFMSTEHCSIQCSPAGFILVDTGATNGCYVNDRKVQKHDLLDNDTITLGKTNFKFKSIN